MSATFSDFYNELEWQCTLFQFQFNCYFNSKSLKVEQALLICELGFALVLKRVSPSNEAPSDVNKLLDGCIYPGRKIARIGCKK